MPILTAEERLGTLVAERYLLCEILGRGGMGVVYVAEHRLSGRRVALKMLASERAQDEQVVKRFLREARAAGRLEHPNVVEVLDVGVLDDGSPYLALELLRGEPLSDHLERKGSLGAERAVELMLPVMGALAAAHEAGIVHRDLKPDNVFLSRVGDEVTPKLLDFGIAKVVDDSSTLRTRTGMVMGTPAYMAPEQARGMADVGPSVDQWSLGVMLFEALTGELPFSAPSFPALIARILTEEPPKLAERDGVPAHIGACIDRALSKDPEARHPSIVAFAAAIREAAAADGLDVDVGGAGRVPARSVPPPPWGAPDGPRHPSELPTVAAGRRSSDGTPASSPSTAEPSRARADDDAPEALAEARARASSDPPPAVSGEPATPGHRSRRGAALGTAAALALVVGIAVVWQIVGADARDAQPLPPVAHSTTSATGETPDEPEPGGEERSIEGSELDERVGAVDEEPIVRADAQGAIAEESDSAEAVEPPQRPVTGRRGRRRRSRRARRGHTADTSTSETQRSGGDDQLNGSGDPMELQGW